MEPPGFERVTIVSHVKSPNTEIVWEMMFRIGTVIIDHACPKHSKHRKIWKYI